MDDTSPVADFGTPVDVNGSLKGGIFMTETYRTLAGSIFDALSSSLRPFLAERMKDRAQTGPWTELLEVNDQVDGQELRRVEEKDLTAQIRILTTRLPQVGYLVELDRRQSRYIGEIRGYRHDWAHGADLEIDDVRRLGDAASRLLSSFELNDATVEIEALLNQWAASTGNAVATEPTGPVPDGQPAPAAEAAKVSIAVGHQPQVNFALVNWITMSATGLGKARGIDLIDSVVVHNNSGLTGTATFTTQLFGAQSALSAPAEQVLELSAGENHLSDTGLIPDPARFFDVEVPEAGRLEFTLSQGGKTLARHISQVSIQPPQSWSLSRERFSLHSELLAAWVQPQDPELVPVIERAQEILKDQTGSSALNAHQQDAERDGHIVNSIFQALQDQQIRYSNPPASWFHSQTIRSPQTVLRDKVATCLDTSVLLASLLEQVGMSPQICLVEGHAFVTVSAERGGMGRSQDDATLVGQWIDAGKLKILESTAVTDEKRAGLEIASQATRSKFFGQAHHLGKFEYLTDIVSARASGIYPLPVRRTSAAGVTQVIAYQPPERRDVGALWRDAKGEATAPVVQSDGRVVPGRIVQWKNQLLDLSLRNRLLNFNNEKVRLPLGVPAKSVDLFEDLLNDGKAIDLLPADAVSPTDLNLYGSGMGLPEPRREELMLEKSRVYVKDDSTQYVKRLRKLATDARTELQQSGTNNLYISLGTLVWTAKDSKGSGKTLRSPLILIPVELKSLGKNSAYRLTMDASGDSTPNYCLLERLWQDHQVKLPGLENLVADQFGMDVNRAFDSITSSLLEHQLDFYVEKSVDLATLQFAKFRLWKDLDENWEKFAKNPLVDHLIHHPTEIFEDPAAAHSDAEQIELDDLVATLPVPADGTQLDAVAMSKQGRSFVIEGPPGTGKSQTITNLLAAAIADGKKVLFVAEKSAALDVVSSRLRAVGLGPFTLDLHDKNSSAVSVRRQLQQSLDHQIRGDEQGHRLVHQDLHSLQRRLNRYARQLHENNPVGYSVYSARSLELALDDDVPALPVPTEFAATKTEDDVDSIRYALRDVPELAERVDRVRHHPWGFANDCPAEDHPEVLSAAEAYATARDELLAGEHVPSAVAVLDTDPDPTFLQELSDLSTRPRPLQDLEAASAPDWSQRIENVLKRAEALRSSETVFGTIIGIESRNDDFPGLIQQADDAAASGFLGIGRKKKLLQVADSVTGGWRGDDEALTRLPELLRSAANSATEAQQIETMAAGISGLDLGSDWSAFEADASKRLREQASFLRDHAQWWNEVRSGRPAPVVEVIDRTAAGELTSLAPALHAYGDALERLKSAVGSPETVWTDWLAGVPLYRRWVETGVPRTSGFPATEQLSAWTRFIRSLDALREHGLDDARFQLMTGEADAERAVQSFESGLARTALDERLTATGLRRFPAKTHERDIQQFDAKSADIRRHMEWKIPHGLLKRRIAYEQTHSASMGRLRREINKKNGGLSVRQLMQQLGNRVQALMPCILVSPDSVARFFPPHADMFDLVVFDEASQVRVADAVGAMGRGNAVIVVGDSKQMPPTSFGAATWNETDEPEGSVPNGDLEEMVTDEESILSECVQARVPRKWLSWHYRSKDESLIAFSNQMYYERKLASFPAPRYATSGPGEGGFGVSWVKVDGHFNRTTEHGSKMLRTNPKEAAAVVDEIRRRFRNGNGDVSLGVVTFNKQQRDLVEDLIRQDDDERMAQSLDGDDEGLFVKNLENVQGDERDIILFSTGFSANEKGALPLNFGPINNPGGERRLNVAVTRARRQVVVFSSFEPEELRSESTSSLGIKHLRAYLDMAKYGPGTLPALDHALDRVDRHRDQVADAFRRQGLAVATDVGLSDFKIDLSLADPDHPDDPLVAVLLDGEEWAQRLTVGDRDGLPGQILKKNLEWPDVVRIWMPEWLQAPAEVEERVLFTYRSALRRREEERAAHQRSILPAPVAEARVDPEAMVGARDLRDAPGGSLQYASAAVVQDTENTSSPDQDSTSASVDTVVPSVFGDSEAASEDRVLTAEVPVREQERESSTTDDARVNDGFDAATFQPQPVKEASVPGGGTVEDLDRMNDPDVQSLVRDKIAAIVRDEWPIHEDRLSKVVNHSFGLKRASASRSQAVKALIDTDVYVIDEDSFVWPHTVDRDNWFEHRTFGSDHVGIGDASPLEVANALMLIVMRTGPRDKEDLFERSKARLGYGRLGNKVVDLLERAIALGISTRRLRRSDDGTIATDLDL